MPNIEAVSHRLAGRKLSDLSENELHDFLTSIARAGATQALDRVGLSDDNAMFDIKDLRDALRAFRVFRKGALQQLGREAINGMKWLLILGAFFLLWNSPTTRKVVESATDIVKGTGVGP